jgi:hypothetical protein
MRLSHLARTAGDKLTAVEDYLTALAAESPDSPALKWVREAVRRPADATGGAAHG